jgi:hypothetical protein
MPKWFNYLTIEPGPKEGVNPKWWLHHRSLARSNQLNWYLLANERICGSLGWHLRLPIPPFALMRKSDVTKRYFASLDFGSKDTQPKDMIPSRVCEAMAKTASGVIVFDIWIANPDRHEQNVKVDDPDNPTRMEVFDHDGALFGITKHRGVERLQSCAAKLGFAKLGSTWQVNKLATAIKTTEHFAHWAQLINDIPEGFICAVCDEAEELGLLKEELDVCKQFLCNRRKHLLDIVNSNIEFFESVTQRGVFA